MLNISSATVLISFTLYDGKHCFADEEAVTQKNTVSCLNSQLVRGGNGTPIQIFYLWGSEAETKRKETNKAMAEWQEENTSGRSPSVPNTFIKHM